MLTLAEIRVVLDDLRRQRTTRRGRLRDVLFRLATCCGLRVSEIAGLTLGDARLDEERPHLRIRAATAKGGRARCVPLTYDAGTLAPLRAWRDERRSDGAGPDDPFLGALRRDRRGLPLSRGELRRQWIRCCAVLGAERCGRLTIHHGRHSCATHLLAAGVPLPNVRDMLGHSNVSVTSVYLHAAEDPPARHIF